MANKNGTPANLIPAKKGEVRNPKGRPPKLPGIDKLLDEVLGEEKDNVTAAKIVLLKLRKMAMDGNVRAAEILLERAYGKPKQNISADVNLTDHVIKFVDVSKEYHKENDPQ